MPYSYDRRQAGASARQNREFDELVKQIERELQRLANYLAGADEEDTVTAGMWRRLERQQQAFNRTPSATLQQLKRLLDDIQDHGSAVGIDD